MSQHHASTPGIEILDRSLARALRPDSPVRCIADGFQFTEGPVWVAGGQFLLFSDIPADTVYRWSEGEGLSVWRRPSHHANGHALDLQGSVISCEHSSRSVTRTEDDGSITTLAASHQGRKLNSPNDVVVKQDGTIWFTDPPYGIRPEEIEQPANYVFRLDVGVREPVPVADDFSRPNGLCFSPDQQFLYIADSDHGVHHIRRFRVSPDNRLEGGEVFVTISPGIPDGLRVDRTGRLFSTAEDGVHIFSTGGDLLGKVKVPGAASNCAFGGGDLTTLFVTAVSKVWAVELGPGVHQV